VVFSQNTTLALQNLRVYLWCREDHPNTLTIMNNIAGTLKAQGNLSEAPEIHEKVLESQRRILGEDHPNTLTSMNNLAETLKAQGKLSEAREMHKKALESSRRILGEDHPNTLTSMNNLALTEAQDGEGVGVVFSQNTTLALQHLFVYLRCL
jgi:tetratricopeptide (TPR) repeat protein